MRNAVYIILVLSMTIVLHQRKLMLYLTQESCNPRYSYYIRKPYVFINYTPFHIDKLATLSKNDLKYEKIIL